MGLGGVRLGPRDWHLALGGVRYMDLGVAGEMRAGAESYRERLERTVLNPLRQTTTSYYAFVAFLLGIVAWGFYAYIVQLRYGLLATGMGDVVVWGIYIANFVFFLGIAMAGTVISAVLRLTNAGWRTPITRLAEVIPVAALL